MLAQLVTLILLPFAMIFIAGVFDASVRSRGELVIGNPRAINWLFGCWAVILTVGLPLASAGVF